MSIHITSTEPINRDYGLYQGVPIARHYIDRYLESLAPKLSGTILEFGRPTYAASLACKFEIIDIDRLNPAANIYLDICTPQMPDELLGRYDFVICTAVLQLVADPSAAIENIRSLLKPGGALIIAEKCISKIDSWSADVDRWRFTPAGLRFLLSKYSRVDVTFGGNLYAVCAYLLGMTAEGTDRDKLDYMDQEYPLVAMAYAEK
jgi:SAM-dependent methyltransferase